MSLALASTRARAASARQAARTLPVAAYFAVWSQRRELARLNDNRLKDLGLSRADVAAEVGRPFWDIR